MTNKLFPQVGAFLHGGDYNPDQWLDRPDILAKDIELMKEAGINCVTLGVFAWATYEPTEGDFHFDWLEEIMDNLYKNGIYTILATPSGARPAWLDEKYPSAMRVDDMGIRARHGGRHNHCMTSPEYRKKVEILDTKLAERFSNHPGLLMWHISNELGGYCFCDSCKKEFQNWLKVRYENNIENLNHAWWTYFWSHRFNNFDQVDPPYKNGESCVMGLNLDWKRYTTWAATDFMNFEIDILRKTNPKIPVTTNLMYLFWDYDYHELTKNLDVVSWDSYPEFHNDHESLSDTFADNAFNHAVYRSMKKDKPFMLMESVPGAVNWHETNKYKRPGIHKLFSLQAVGSGSDSVLYFQIRKSRGSSEQHHGAVIDHMGTNETRTFKSVAAIGDDLSKLSKVTGSLVKSRVAIIYDWDNRWAVDDARILAQETKKFERVCMDIYKELLHLGIDADIISSDYDFDSYDVIFAPMLYLLHDGMGDKLKAFVLRGGQLLSTYFTGYVDKNTLAYLGGFPGDGLSDLFGVISEEMDALYPSDENHMSFTDAGTKIYDSSRLDSIRVYEYQELLRLKGAKVLAEYTEDYLKGTPAMTVNECGNGKAYYVAARTAISDLEPVIVKMLSDANIDYRVFPCGVEYHKRVSDEGTFEFFMNMTDVSVSIDGVTGVDMLSKAKLDGSITIPAMDVVVVES